MRIQDLRPASGSKKRRKIIGRGPGSGHGKTSTRGHKGQMARSGKGRSPGFEGGQMPLVRRMPKRGFNKRPKKGYCIINLDALAALKKETTITPQLLEERGLVRAPVNFLKILGRGNIDVPVNIKAHAFSKVAVEKIKSAGGTCEIYRRTKQVNSKVETKN